MLNDTTERDKIFACRQTHHMTSNLVRAMHVHMLCMHAYDFDLLQSICWCQGALIGESRHSAEHAHSVPTNQPLKKIMLLALRVPSQNNNGM